MTPSCLKISNSETATCPLAEAPPRPVESDQGRNALPTGSLHRRNHSVERTVDHRKADNRPPPPVISAEPDADLERKLKRDPDDLDAKADVGSDEPMDASDPPAAAQPGQTDDPVPSSGFPH